jgi:hypothetical protein
MIARAAAAPTKATAALAFEVKCSNVFRSVLRQDFRKHLIDAYLFGDGLHGTAIVAGHHYGFDTFGTQSVDCRLVSSFNVSATVIMPTSLRSWVTNVTVAALRSACAYRKPYPGLLSEESAKLAR